MTAQFKKSYLIISAAAVLLLIITGTVLLTNAKTTANADNTQNSDIISENTVDYNRDSKNEKLIVRMADGRHYEDKEPGPFMGWKWEGKFLLQLVDESGKTISEYDLNNALEEEQLIFQNTFKIEVDDYNNDGNIDFTIGQYASSSGNVYRLFTVMPDGTISILPVKGKSEIFATGGGRYSMRFEKTGPGAIKYQYYDNSKGENVEVYYSWPRNTTSDNISLDKLVLDLPASWTMERNPSQITFYDENKQAAGGVQIIGYYGDLMTAIPNHSEITGQDDIATSLGNGKLVSLKMSSPAASGNRSEWTEIHIFIPTSKPNMGYDFWIMGQDRDVLLKMLKDAHK